MNVHSISNSRGMILIVDDTPDNLRLLTRLLREQHYDVRAVTSGHLALTVSATTPPDLILLDICMPEIDGYEVCRRLKADDRLCQIPVIFLSALDEITDKLKAFEVGGVDYITKPFEITEVLMRVKTQISLAVTRKQLQQMNTDLEQQVAARTVQLQLAFDFEATLKRITDKVRDSLDEEQIMQTAVQALATAVGALCCNAALYDLEQQTSTIRYEYTTLSHSAIGRLSLLTNYPEIYDQLLQGQVCQFCSISPSPVRGHVAMLACPIQDDQGVLGDLWLVNHSSYAFSEQDIGLIAQVSNQCAIALRQSRLYQAAQAQVEELQRLNQLKDDFLNTVSHELRTPMSTIQMATQMLEISLTRAGILNTAHTARNANDATGRYFQILKDQCRREIKLIENLLDLAYLDSATEPLTLTPIDLSVLLPYIAKPFVELAQTNGQSLSIALSAGLPSLRTDLSYLERILTELLNNAVKYSPANEQITLAACLVPAEATTAACLQIQVTNSGVEIPPAEYDHIYDRFYRIPNQNPHKYAGTGLGLALVKKLVDRLEGKIWVESGANQTRFILQMSIETP